MNNFSYSYSRWRRLEVWQSVCTVLGVLAVAAERVGYFEIWWHIDGLQWSTVFDRFLSFTLFYTKWMPTLNSYVSILTSSTHLLHYLIQCQQLAFYCRLEITTFEFFLVDFSSKVVAIVCSFSVKISNPRPKARFFRKVGMVSEGPGRGGVATRSVTGVP